MILSMSRQAVLFLLTVGAGFCMGFFYDILRILRKTTPHKDAVIQLEDLLYWVLVSLLMFYSMLRLNYGEIRLFMLIGAGVGMTLYFLTLSVVVMTVSVAVVNFCKKVFAMVFKILSTPLRLVWRLIRPRLGKLLRKAKFYAKIKTRTTSKNLSIIRKKI